MRWIAVLLLFAVPAYPQDTEKNLEQAEKLEAQAERLLDAGKRKEAFEALAKASELRRKAKAGPKSEAKPKVKPEAGKPIRKPKPSPNPEKVTDPVEVAHAELDAALRKGDLEAAKVASERLRDARVKQAKRIAALEKRLQAMQRQMVEIRKLLATGKRPK